MIRYIKGDLFSHKPRNSAISILAHACNCQGSWGAGVAKIFQKKFPSTYDVHTNYCKQHSTRGSQSPLLGTTQLIPSSVSDPGTNGGEDNFYVACLFTSDFAGAKKLEPLDIVHYTDLAMLDISKQLVELSKSKEIETEDGKFVINMPKINAGLFNVPWEATEAVLKKYDRLHINVYVID